jgi:protease-4
MSADVMWREIELTAREKPVIVSMGKVAASGGYYAAAPAKLIFATPYTVTGSIGIFYGKADVSELLTKLGVSVETLRTAPRADAESMYRPFTDDERIELGNKVKQFYDVFIDRVSRGRHMRPDQVHEVAQGRVWMGRAAQAHGLVDRIGGLRQALIEAQRQAGLPSDAPVIELPPPDSSLLETIASAAGVQMQAPDPSALALLPGQFGDVVRSLGTFVLYSPDQPMALLEFTDNL